MNCKKKYFITFSLIFIVVFIVAFIVALTNIFIPKYQIEKAKQLIEIENYDSAYAILENNISKFDAKEILYSNKYKRACELLENGDYETALTFLVTIPNYNDSNNLKDEANYQLAKQNLKNRNNTLAAWYFMQSFSYKDSQKIYCNLINDKYLDDNGSSIVLKDNGKVLANVILPENDTETTSQYNKQAGTWEDVKSVASGSYFVLGLKNDGTVYAVGKNDTKQCNTETWNSIIQIAADGHSALGLKSDGSVVSTGSNDFGQCNVNGWTDIVSVSIGDNHSVGLNTDGTVDSTGSNEDGQCNVAGWTDIVAVETGYNLTIGLKKDGTVISTNDELNESLSSWKDIIEVSTDGFYVLGLKKDGIVVSIGYNENGQCNVQDFKNITEICAAGFHSYAICSNGTILGNGGLHRIPYSEYTNIKTNSFRIQHEAPLSDFVGTWVCTKENSCNNMDITLVVEQYGNALYFHRTMGNKQNIGYSDISFSTNIPTTNSIDVNYIKGVYTINNEELIESFSNDKENKYILHCVDTNND